jgi:DNA-binding NarL/FixJ family response regulator
MDLPLSPREAQVSELVAAGYSNREIAEALCVGEDTVKKHISHALTKTGMHNRTELAVLLLAQHFLH